MSTCGCGDSYCSDCRSEPDALSAEREKWARIAERRASEIFEGSFTDWAGKHEARRALLWMAEQLRRGR